MQLLPLFLAYDKYEEMQRLLMVYTGGRQTLLSSSPRQALLLATKCPPYMLQSDIPLKWRGLEAILASQSEWGEPQLLIDCDGCVSECT